MGGSHGRLSQLLGPENRLFAMEVDVFFDKGRYIDGPLEGHPVRLGTHDDWVALGNWNGESVALAADGTLWSWPASDAPPGWDRDEPNDWLVPSRRPAKIENILDAGQQK